MKYFPSLLLALSVCLAAEVFAQRELLPVDQAAQQPDFFSFRAQLLAAVARRDSDAILAVVSEDITNSFGGVGGVAEFKRMWDIASPESRLWATMATILGLGGTFIADGRFTAPYTFSRWPRDLDPFTHMVVIGASVRARSAPSVTATPLASFSFAIVELAKNSDWGSPWLAIRLPGGKTGYMNRRYIRSPVGYRASFEKRDGRWQMTILVAGD